MKIDRSKLRKSSSEAPVDCKALIEKLKSCAQSELSDELSKIKTWNCGKCELYHWIDVLDRFDVILKASCEKKHSKQWCIPCDGQTAGHQKLKELLIEVLQFTALLIEHSFSRHFYNSMEHLTTLLSSSDMQVVLAVLNLLYVFSKRSNFITRLNSEKRQVLLSRLLYLAENWGGKENGFGLADCCQDFLINHFPSSACTLHFEYYAENSEEKTSNTLFCIHIDNVDLIPNKTCSEIMEELIRRYAVRDDKQMQLFTHLRLAHSFSSYPKRLQCVQARLQALSVLVYCSAVPDNVNSLLYNGLLEELVDVLEIKNPVLFEIKSASLRTLTSIIHFNRNPTKLTAIIDATGASSYHGFLPVLVRNCIQSLMDDSTEPFPQPLATAIFSFLYHLASYESGGEALVSCGMMESLLKVIDWHTTGPEHIHFVTRAVRVIELITNLDMQAFQAHGGLKSFIERLKVEVDICRKDDLANNMNCLRKSQLDKIDAYLATTRASVSPDRVATESVSPMELDTKMAPLDELNVDSSRSGTFTTIQVCTMDPKENAAASTSSSPCSGSSNSLKLVLYESVPNSTIPHCFPQRAALLKAMLNFLKKAIQDPTFSEQIRHMMDGSLPSSLVHIIGFAEYYGPSLFYIATEVVTVYVFQEPTVLTSLQDNLVPDVILKALLVKEIPASREVLSSLPNVFSALCLNSRGLGNFTSYKPFERIFKVLVSPQYLPAMRKRRTGDPMSDTASNLGNAMDELMRHQPSLRSDATTAIIKLLEELCTMGRDPQYVCSRPASKQETTTASTSRANNISNEAGSSDEDDDDDEETDVNSVSGPLSKSSVEKSPDCSGSKTPVPLVDYILNVMRFVDAILSNNSTDDHCREFVRLRGLTPLMGILGLPNLPIDFPITATCQAVASVCKSILNLAHDPQVLKQGLINLNEVLENLEPLHWPVEHPGGSVLLEELVNAPNLNDAISNPQATPLLHHMAAAHAYIIMFMHVCRTGQTDIRTISISHWGSDLGLSVLRGLSKLYTSLVWESTVLLALCGADDGLDQDCQFGRHQLEKLFPKEHLKDKTDENVNGSEFSSNGVTTAMEALSTNGSSAMDIDETCKSMPGEPPSVSEKCKAKQFQMQIKQIKPLLSGASRLGRALAELFGLLVKLCVGSPGRQRRGQQVPPSPNAPTPSARAVANALTQLLAKGLSWEPPATSPIPKFRLTFLICSVGFTSPMLFDERKLPYHLMLQMFLMCGGQDAFFETFRWALTCGGKIPIEDGMEHPDLPDGTAEFLDAWLMLLEKMVNPKTVFDSPHIVPHKPNSPGIVFDPAFYLSRTHKQAFDSIMCLWGRKPLHVYGERMTESMLTILCHLLKGEPVVKVKLQKADDATGGNPIPTLPLSNPPVAPLPRPVRNARLFDLEDTVNQGHLQQLVDMGFSRTLAIEALVHTNSLEQATEYLLNSPGSVTGQCSTIGGINFDWDMSEEDQMMRAIAMSLGESVFTSRHQDEDVNFVRSSRPLNPESYELKPEEPLSTYLLSDFSKRMLAGCLKLLDSIPETVYRICDVLVVAAKRNGERWRNDMLIKLIKDIEVDIAFIQKRLDLTKPRSLFEKKQQSSDMNQIPTGYHFTAVLHLFTLLFEEMKLPCSVLVEEYDLIDKVVKLILSTTRCLGSVIEPLPRWLPFLILIVDTYEKASTISKRKAPILKAKRVWKWFDDRTGKWNSYTVVNNKTIDDAYVAGEQNVQFVASRKHYTVHLTTMVQVNEETGNWRPIMLIADPKDEKDIEKKETAKGKDKPLEGDEAIRAQELNATIQALTQDLQTTCETIKIVEPITQDQAIDLLRASAILLSVQGEPDTLHAYLRLCLRLTKNHSLASFFSQIGGPELLLSMKQPNSFTGYASLVTLLLRHIIEDSVTIGQVMEKVVKAATVGGASSLFVSKEMHYIFRVLGPAACRDPELFASVATNTLRIALLPVSKREEEDNRYSNSSAMQMLKSILTKSVYSTPLEIAEGMDISETVISCLMNCLVAKEEIAEVSNEAETINGEQNSETNEAVPCDLTNANADVTDDDDTVNLLQLTGVAGVGIGVDGFGDGTDSMSSVREGTSKTKKLSKENENEVKTSPKGRILTKSAVCRILAELVRSYPQCAKLVADHRIPNQVSELVPEGGSALAFILDNLLHPGQIIGDKDAPVLANLLIAALASCTHSSEAQTILVTEVKSSLNRALLLPESSDKHSRVQALTRLISTMIESCPAPSAQSQVGVRPQTPSMNNIVRILLRKGVLVDLARIAHHLDLSSPHLSATVNCALKPLETLTRIVNLPTGQSANKGAKNKTPSSCSEVREPPEAMDDDASNIACGVAEHMPAMNTSDTTAQEISLDSELEGIMNEIFEGHGTNEEPISLSSGDHQESSDSESNPESCHSRGDDDVGREERVDDEEDDEDDDEDGLSHCDMIDELQEYAFHRLDTYASIPLQEMLNASSGGSSVIFGTDTLATYPISVGATDDPNGAGTTATPVPPAPRTLTTTHPLLVRHGDVQYNFPTRMHRRQRGYRPNIANQGWHVFTNGGAATAAATSSSTRQPNPPAILQRLLGPTTAQDLLQWTSSLNSHSSGTPTRVVLANTDLRIFTADDEVFEVQDQNGLLPSDSSGPLSSIPSTLTRWNEEARALDGDSIHDTVTAVKPDIIKKLEVYRDEEILERREKRRKLQEEEGKKNASKQKPRGHSILDVALDNSLSSEGLDSVAMEVAEPASQFESNIASTFNPPVVDLTSNSDQDLRSLNTERLAASIVEQVLGPALSFSSTSSAARERTANSDVNFITPQIAEATAAAVTTFDQVRASHPPAIPTTAASRIPQLQSFSSPSMPMDTTEHESSLPSSSDFLQMSEILSQELSLESDEQLDIHVEENSNSTADDSQLVSTSDEPSFSQHAIETSMLESFSPSHLEEQEDISILASTSTQTGSCEELSSTLGEIPEGVDPSFLAALPDNIRQEVISEQLRLQRIRQRALGNNSQASNEGSSFTEVNPEFLAALPPNIQEEVLAQQRAEQQRLEAQNCNPDAPVDPTNFIQTLPQGLRQQVLADMDDSLLALLPPEVASEAHTLRREVEARHRQFQERFFSSHAGSALSRILRTAGRVSRYAIHTHTLPHRSQWAWSTLSNRTASGSQRVVNSSPSAGCLRLKGRLLLDHEALSCLLVLLFVDDPHLHTARLHRVLRNLCHHAATRNWIIKSLLAILERTKDYKQTEEVTAPRHRHKRSARGSALFTPPSVTTRSESHNRAAQPTWLSISFDAALGCRTGVFQTRRLTMAQRRAYERHPHQNQAATSVTIHPLASPIVCRHVLDTLISLAKSFPTHFLPEAIKIIERKDFTAKGDKSPKASTSSYRGDSKQSKESPIPQKPDCDFWNILIKLDSSSHKGKSALRPHSSVCSYGAGREEESNPGGFESSPLAHLICLLSHPVVKRSSLLTDRLLRLLALISLAMPEQKGVVAQKSGSGIPLRGQPSERPTQRPGPSSQQPGTSSDSWANYLPPFYPRQVPLHDHAQTLRQHLKLAVEVLTSKTCSEEGLEDATSLLLRLSRQCTSTRKIVLQLLLDGAGELGDVVRQHIRCLRNELKTLNAGAASIRWDEEKEDSEAKLHQKGIIQDRFTNAPVVITAPTKISRRELQLPSMTPLTSKTSSQAFFLRVLKVIIQLKEISMVTKNDADLLHDVESEVPPPSAHNTPARATDTAEATTRGDFSAVADLSTVANPAPSLNQPNLLSIPMDVEYSNACGKRDYDDDDSITLRDVLRLDDLWQALTDCLLELADTPDHHAVLVLQPAVEAFFLVHSSGTDRSSAKKRDAKRRREYNPSDSDVHFPDTQPPSPPRPLSGSSSGPAGDGSSDSQNSSMSYNTYKFLKFAETHRTVLNQILRQSTTPLADGPFSVLVDHTRVLDFDVKRRYFRQELDRMDEGSRREDLAVHVRRDNVFEDSFRELHRRTPEEWKNRFYIVFEGEEGQDAGGLLREWYTIISREIFNPMYALFTTSPGDCVTYMINPSSHCNSNHLSYFKFVGRVIAKAVYDNKLLECYFTRAFYKHILGKLVRYTDMESEDYTFYQSLVYLLENDVQELGYDITFSVEVPEFGVTEVRDLKPNGRNIAVTEETKSSYVHLVCQEKMTGAIRKQLNAFLEGFYEIIPKRLISIFNEQELELLISGLPNIDVEDLKCNTEYHKYQPNSLQVQWFWRALRSFDQADRANFLQFVTGTSKVPLQGFSALEGMSGPQKFQIHRDDRSTNRLPSAHTCFNQLDLPAYETYDKLRSMLLKAIHECSEGFGFA